MKIRTISPQTHPSHNRKMAHPHRKGGFVGELLGSLAAPLISEGIGWLAHKIRGKGRRKGGMYNYARYGDPPPSQKMNKMGKALLGSASPGDKKAIKNILKTELVKAMGTKGKGMPVPYAGSRKKGKGTSSLTPGPKGKGKMRGKGALAVTNIPRSGPLA